jgi:hypothetical protein
LRAVMVGRRRQRGGVCGGGWGGLEGKRRLGKKMTGGEEKLSSVI